MKKRSFQGRPDRVALAMTEAPKLEETDAGWTTRLYTQLYGIVNDRLWRFQPGSHGKTFRERVPTGSIKVHDGHNFGLTASGTVGRLIDGGEDEKGAWGMLFISKAEEKIAQKLADGTITEISEELFPIRKREASVSIEEVPEESRPFAEMNAEGKARILDLLEVKVTAVGLVSASSQGRNVMIDPPTVITFQDLPVSRSNFDPVAAAERLATWAGLDESQSAGGQPVPNLCRLSRGFLVQIGDDLLGQIADVDDGDLVVSSGALERAYETLFDELLQHPLTDSARAATLAAASRQIGRYEEQLRRGLTGTEKSARVELRPAPAGAAPPKGTHSDAKAASLWTAPAGDAPPKGTHSDGADEAAWRLGRLEAEAKLLGLEAIAAELEGVGTNVSAGTGRESE